MTGFVFPRPSVGAEAGHLRGEVRGFLEEHADLLAISAGANGWNKFDPVFSRLLGQRGWIGMTWPRKYGGHARSALERYVVIEELLAAGAPVGAHWIADRQFGPLLLGHGSEALKQDLLPRIVAGQCYVSVGLSEPDAGSDLASVQTRAVPVEGGFRLSGTKVWTTRAHESHYIVVLCRTDGAPGDRHIGLSQLLVDFAWPGITIRPIVDMTGSHSFNEVHFDDVFVPGANLIGTRGNGWKQVTSEMGNERSGPDRFLSSFPVLSRMVREAQSDPDASKKREIGRLVSHTALLRRLSVSVAELVQQGEDPTVQGALVKDLGALLEQETPQIARQLFGMEPAPGGADAFSALVAETLLAAPSFSLRGGTREILRGIIARGLGVR